MSLMDEILDSPCGEEELLIFWLGQNSFILKSLDSLVGIDLYLSRVYEREAHIHETPPILPEGIVIDYVFSTHDHLDHLDPHSIPTIYEKNPEAVFISTPEGHSHLKELGIPEEHAFSMRHLEEIELRDFTVTAFQSILKEDKPNTTHLGYLFNFTAGKVYNMGDSDEKTAENPVKVLEPVAKEKPDIAILPIIGDIPNRTPHQALRFAEVINPKIAIPSHYGCFEERDIDPKAFSDLFRTQNIKPVIIEYGGKFNFTKNEQ